MAGRSKGEPSSDFSRRIVANVESLRDEVGMTNVDLIRAANLSSNYFYTRLRFEAPFNANDIERLAHALGVGPEDLVVPREAMSERRLHLLGNELARRLRVLLKHASSMDPSANILGGLSAYLDSQKIAFSVDRWNVLLDEDGPVRISQRLLEAIASYFDVEGVYLVNFRNDEVRDRVEAELELRSALHQAGAESVATRALGGISPSALRAVARAIREGSDE